MLFKYNVFFIRMSLTVLKTLWNFILAYTITKHLKTMLLLKTMSLRFQKCQLHSVSLCEKHIILKTSFLWEFDLAEFGRTSELAYLLVMYFYENQIYTFQYFRRSGLTLKVVGPHNIVSK